MRTARFALQSCGSSTSLGSFQLDSASCASKELEKPQLQKTEVEVRFLKGQNLVEIGFPKYVAPGEPEPGTGQSVK